MPKQTFINLDGERQAQIMTAALDEFSSYTYAEASTNRICKNAGIAKGSFYQYFEDKLDLYVYLLTQSTGVKMGIFGETLKNLDKLTFLEQIKALYLCGIEFAIQNPKYSRLADKFAHEKNDHVKQSILTQKAYSFYETLIEKAKEQGTVKAGINTRALALLIGALNDAVLEYMTEQYDSPDFASDKASILEFVDLELEILKLGIDNVTK
jgi:AcrR family transcriptional regulator